MTKNFLPPFEEPSSEEQNSDDPRSEAPTSDNGTSLPSDEFTGEFSNPVKFHITDVLDLHTVSPRDAEAVVEEYLHECYRLELTAIRIIHGRGIGVQRAMVRKVLERTEFVVSFGDAPMEAGGWGATIVTLRRR
jgi:dsDNA-specific endonuclease/ATPase MutS2